ncbi:MAG: hypothetical protein ABEL04_06515 [Salinibacter sp.]|uniref:hypothetical protein n=1 Tax=Salinibacter sp. TaxID=2065818 RepID=UPI0035D45F83
MTALADETDQQTGNGSTQEKIEAQHERAEELGDLSPEALLLVLTEQMRDVLVHVRELTREVVTIRANLEDKGTEEVLSEVTERLDRASGEEELLRLKSIYDFLEEREASSDEG